MKKILIVDDHESIRESFRGTLEATGDYEVVGDIPDASLADIWRAKLNPDMVLLDVCTENGASGLEAAKILRREDKRLKIIVMSGFDEISFASRAKEAGADAFLYKSQSLAFFMTVIHSVFRGETYFPEPRAIPMPVGEKPLTCREMELLRLLCERKSRKEIAAALYISEMTVKRHVANMLEKTGFSSSVDLAFYMITNGWIKPDY